ncbi:ssDNA endodeoxyribonuclease [Saitozyma podzolica]|uniref:SsDNA endodeoxyribonuclease n=1 Tax=Saitozyma podzolica TaxID=1890683 RepID=A0A427YRY8_9TREE|nr:ssDNA endodeoxyribonuclease [Saitozyma podzolica]
MPDSPDPFTAGAPVPREVLRAETNDVRPFARLLRGIGLKHNAVMSISEAGFEVAVEEVRTLGAIAFIPTNLFTSWTFHPPSEPAIFELSLDALLQCLNIFGNAGSSGAGAGSQTSIGRTRRRWAGEGEDGNDDDDAGTGRGAGKGKRTGMVMSWEGHGEPLRMTLHDEGKGPITTCELNTYVPEELMNQAFDHDQRVLYLIMKSEWFRDALLDLPPTSTRITLVATPATNDVDQIQGGSATVSSNNRRANRTKVGSFSIQAEGDFGSTELPLVTLRPPQSRVAPEYQDRAHGRELGLPLRADHDARGDKVGLGEHQGILEFKMHALEEIDGDEDDE